MHKNGIQIGEPSMEHRHNYEYLTIFVLEFRRKYFWGNGIHLLQANGF